MDYRILNFQSKGIINKYRTVLNTKFCEYIYKYIILSRRENVNEKILILILLLSVCIDYELITTACLPRALYDSKNSSVEYLTVPRDLYGSEKM